MSDTADAVIIGGGINGTSTAYYLARRGVKKVVLLEKSHIASGPTGRSSGVVRQHYSLEPLAAMARDSVKVWRNFAEIIGGDAGFVQCGVVFLCGDEDVRAMKANVTMHQRIGIRETLVSAADLKEVDPMLSCEDIALAGYDQDGGYADPALAANSFAQAAEREGVEIRRKTQVTGLKVDGERVRGVITDKGELDSDVVINIAGPWGKQIAAMSGVELPISTARHPVVILQRPFEWRSITPVWADLINGWYFKPEGTHSMMVGCLHETASDQNVDIENHTTAVHFEEMVKYSEAILKRFPVMEAGLAQGGWAGLYDVTPDGQPVIDRIAEIDGFYCACGFSGHGFKIAPAIGQIMTELVTEGTCHSYDISPFRYARFREGDLTRTAYAYSIVG